jgi:hypothetical protein
MKGDGVSRCKDCVNIGAAPRVSEEITSPPPAPGRSHPHQLQALDNLTALGNFTYIGWQADVRRAEDLHVSHPALFDDFVEGKMRRKQALYDGDLSHPQLQMLDNLKREGLSYVGWESDVRRAENEEYAFEFDGHVERIRKKQKIHLEDRSHPQLQVLDNLKRAGLTYIGWEEDVRRAEDLHVSHPALFDDFVEGKMRRKQALYAGDLSHPQLQMLENLKREGLSYVGWESDVRRAENEEYAFEFDGHVEKMRKKQAIYISQQNAQRLPAQVSNHPRSPEPKQQMARRIDDRQSQLAGTNESEECVICWSSKKTHAFILCGHMCVCNGCVASIQDHRCPICRMASQQIVKIYQ